MTNDEQLLHAYARERSESAFGELVTRHIDFVYSTALRVVNGDSHLAQDVAQTVFIDLARKAGSLPGDVGLAGWLHHHTCYTAATAVRTERRRKTREEIAMEMRALDDNTRPEWEQVAPYLDESLDQLNPADRDALVLRFLKQQDLRAVGAALGISDDAARKRVDRALEKLHVLLKHRGATLSAAALGTALATEAVTAAPAGLAATISATALAGTTLAAAAAKAIAMTTLQKTLITATITVLAAGGIYEARQAANTRAEVKTIRELQTALTERIRQLEYERDNATSRLTDLLTENSRLKSNTNEMELLRLRNAVSQLRRERDARQQAFEQAPPAPATDKPATGAGRYISKDQLVFGGYSTPETAFQSKVWALTKGSFDQATASFDTSSVTNESRVKQTRGDFEREQKVMETAFKGMQIVARKTLEGGRVELKCRMDFDDPRGRGNGQSPFTIEAFVKVGNEWKSDNLPRPWQPGWDLDGQIQVLAQ